MDSLIIEICLLSLFIRNPWFPISSTQRYILTLSAMSIYPRLHHFDRHLRTGVGHKAALCVWLTVCGRETLPESVQSDILSNKSHFLVKYLSKPYISISRERRKHFLIYSQLLESFKITCQGPTVCISYQYMCWMYMGDDCIKYPLSASALATSAWWLSISEALGTTTRSFPKCNASSTDPEPTDYPYPGRWATSMRNYQVRQSHFLINRWWVRESSNRYRSRHILYLIEE